MNGKRFIIRCIIGIFLILGLTALSFFCRSCAQERALIRTRYQQMRTALTKKDTNAVMALIAPQYRGGFDNHKFTNLNDFAGPLGSRSLILNWANEATVWPVLTSHFMIFPGGDTIEMVRVSGDWFFTGQIHID